MMMFFRTTAGGDDEGGGGGDCGGGASPPSGTFPVGDEDGEDARPATADYDDVREGEGEDGGSGGDSEDDDDEDDDGDDSVCSTEEAIRLMRLTDLAVDPGHYHAFRRTSTPSVVLSSIFSSSPVMAAGAGKGGKGRSGGAEPLPSAGSCLGCGRRFYSLSLSLPWRSSSAQSTTTGGGAGGGTGGDNNLSGPGAEVLRCVSCGAHAHRGCAFSSSYSAGGARGMMRMCPVNEALVAEGGGMGDGELWEEELEDEECDGVTGDAPASAMKAPHVADSSDAERGDEHNSAGPVPVPGPVPHHDPDSGETEAAGKVVGVAPRLANSGGAGLGHADDAEGGGRIRKEEEGDGEGEGSSEGGVDGAGGAPPPAGPASPTPPATIVPVRTPAASVFAAIAIAPAMDKNGTDDGGAAVGGDCGSAMPPPHPMHPPPPPPAVGSPTMHPSAGGGCDGAHAQGGASGVDGRPRNPPPQFRLPPAAAAGSEDDANGNDNDDGHDHDHDDSLERAAIVVPRCTSLDEDDVDVDDESSGEERHVWQSDGPPSHWAVERPRSLEGIATPAAPGDVVDVDAHVGSGTAAVDYLSSVSSVSRVLQANLVTFFGGGGTGGGTGRDGGGSGCGVDGGGGGEAAAASTVEDGGAEEEAAVMAAAIASLENEDGKRSDAAAAANGAAIEMDGGGGGDGGGDAPPPPPSPRDVVEATAVGTLGAGGIDDGTATAAGDDVVVATTDGGDDDGGSSSPARVTLEIAKKTGRAATSIAGIAGTVGSVVGGVAGLALAGPLGFVVGSKIGQVCGIVGVVLQGGRVLVLGAGAVAAGLTLREAVAKNGKLRVLTLGGGGGSGGGDGDDDRHRLVLVRPYVEVDPMWEDVVADIRVSAPDARRRTLFGPATPDMDRQRRERVERDADIVQADEGELGPRDKVTLLVSRGLNDKSSLPGHVYRCLIQKHRERSGLRRRPPPRQGAPGVECGDGDVEKPSEHKVDDDVGVVADARGRRQDAHAVILHVTKTLLEVRPGFGANPVLTEMTATAVETLVFGELYDSVFEEIVQETSAQDCALAAKIQSFQNERSAVGAGPSEKALHTLRKLPEAHTAVDKLSYCVRFLELISTQYSEDICAENDRDGIRADCRGNSAIGADSLLILVCQHIIRAGVPRLNAEIAFLEEFARDEYLLRGKEGYALVTLQASLHFLNASDDLERDIFQDDR